MNDYQSNSFKSKEERTERRHEKAISGSVKKQKPSVFTWFIRNFFSEDVGDLKSYILTDVLLPAIKRTFLDVIKGGAELAINGRAGKASSAITQKVGYSSISTSNGSTVKKERPVYRGFDEIIFEDRGDAEAVLMLMQQSIETYHNVSVLEMFDFAGITTMDYTWSKYGWTDISSAQIVRIQDGPDIGYKIRLPRAVPLN